MSCGRHPDWVHDVEDCPMCYEDKRAKRMSTIKIEVGKFGQCTRVIVDGQHAYDTAVVPKRELEKLTNLIKLLGVENTEIVLEEK